MQNRMASLRAWGIAARTRGAHRSRMPHPHHALLAAIAVLAAACQTPRAPAAPPTRAPVASQGRLIWLGGPTAILERDGLRVMTDPMLGHHGPRAFVLPRHPSTGATDAPIARYTDPPAVALAPLDAVILSHGHNDHFDRPRATRCPRTRS